MAKRIQTGNQIIDFLEKNGFHKMGEDFEQYKDYATIEYTYSKGKALKPNTPRVVFTVDAENDAFLDGYLYPDGSKGYATDLKFMEDLEYFLNSANWENAIIEKRGKAMKRLYEDYDPTEDIMNGTTVNIKYEEFLDFIFDVIYPKYNKKLNSNNVMVYFGSNDMEITGDNCSVVLTDKKVEVLNTNIDLNILTKNIKSVEVSLDIKTTVLRADFETNEGNVLTIWGDL